MGPFEVHSQFNPTSVVLRHPETKELIGGGVAVPMDQILAGPRRARINVEVESDCRGFSDMLSGEGAPGAGEPEIVRMHSGPMKSSRRKRWTEVGKGAYVAYQTTGSGPRRRMLSIGRIISNSVYAQTVLLQPH